MEGAGSSQRSSCPAQPFSPAPQPSQRLLPGRPRQEKEQQPGNSAPSLQGSGCPSSSKVRTEAEVSTSLPLPAGSRGCPISGTALFPAHPRLHSAFQPGAEPCCVLLVHVLVSLLTFLMCHGHPQAGALLGTLTHWVPVLLKAPHHRAHKRVMSNSTSPMAKMSWGVFPSFIHQDASPYLFPFKK